MRGVLVAMLVAAGFGVPAALVQEGPAIRDPDALLAGRRYADEVRATLRGDVEQASAAVVGQSTRRACTGFRRAARRAGR